MFYTQLFTSSRGPLAKIWLAAHWERKLTRAQVFECNLEIVIRDMISPKVKIGLRTSGHLLVGVVRIYSRKAKYLLADCGEALIKVKDAFRPGQTDLAVKEAERRAITLIEDFTAFEDFAVFDARLPDLSDIDLVDHFSLNQSRTEEITLKEDFGNEFLTLVDFGDESQINHTGLMDMSLQSLSHHGDAFGDEDRGFDLLDFLTNSSDDAESTDFIAGGARRENATIPPLACSQGDEPECPLRRGPESAFGLSVLPDAGQTRVETPALSETTVLGVEETGFALEPVPITPNSEKRRGKRRRKLIVDQNKELSDATIRAQISDFSDLVATMDLAPPTQQLMFWKESGGARRLLSRPCSAVVAPQVIELFSKCGKPGVRGEVEKMRQDRREGRNSPLKDRRDASVLSADGISIADSSLHRDLALTSHMTAPLETPSSCTQVDESQGESGSTLAQPELPPENSTLVHPSLEEEGIHLSSLNSWSAEDSQVFEDGNIKRDVQELLDTLNSDRDATFSLKSLCDGVTRSQAAKTFFCLLVLRKRQRLHLQQDGPYEDILVIPGPKDKSSHMGAF
ncbi:double-strand-break repair protein rad21-like protein 1 isoform X1 [Takifugu flavidus]|uniref:Double-strand-break repair protein rad21-like protein 1 n=1 Tax=Takifugu flavidus TaxID=433684 RepID=A0A5C6MPI5_9TELE|nr:double-strand-break repair protein rad21-like protein 1 isoform X1 [Takifugu flavidus]TWW57066.1 Double-strand-break repair protein rad21-like protein 1 [Takifugu flavidus]